MDWISISWPMAIAACLTLAVIHLQISFRLRGRERVAHFFFTLSAIAVAATGGFELVLLRTQTLSDYQRLMLWAEIPLCAMVISLGGFAWNIFERGNRWLVFVSASLFAISTVANLLVPPELRIRHAIAIHTASSFGGVTFTLPTIKNGTLTACEVTAVLLLIAFVAHSAFLTWRKGDRRRALLIGGGIIFFQSISRGYALLVESGTVETPFFFIFPFLGLLLAMGQELSLDVFRAAKLAERLRESEQRMELAARAATLGFWFWDLKRDELWATESARSLFGVPKDEQLNFARFAARLHPDDLDHVRKAIDESILNGVEYETDYRIITDRINQRWISARGRVEKDAAGNSAFMRGVVMDVTAHKKAQFEADQLRGELAHVTRVSTMGELAASMAHELNQPLAAILSNAQAARRFLAQPDVKLDEIRDILDDIVRDDKRAGEVIHRLRALVQKKEHVQAESLDLNELVRDAERLLNSECVSRNIEVITSLSVTVPVAFAGRVEVQQVLLNLMVNAMDAMRDLAPDKRKIFIETGSGAGSASVVVRDTGPGISDAVMTDIFRPFFTTKQHGLGMGLAISRSIVEAYGGKLTAQNHPSGGAVFNVDLPSRSKQTHHG